MKTTRYLAFFLVCNLIQVGYFISEPTQNIKIEGESTVSIRIGMSPMPTTSMTPAPTSIIYRINPSSLPTSTPPSPTIIKKPPEEAVMYKATIFGMTSPKSQVQLSNSSVFVATISDEKGNFNFSNQLLPIDSPEVCLETKDSLGRTSSPVCLPPIPTNYAANIGPIIIPPTMSLNKSEIYIGDEARLSGQSIPNSQVEISMYTDEKIEKLALFPNAYAKTSPKTIVMTDDKGNYSVNIPTRDDLKMKTFAQVFFEDKPSDKSPALSFEIYLNWMFVIILIQRLIEILKTNLLAFTFLIEVIIATIVFVGYFSHPKRVKKVKHMATKQL